MRRYDDELEIIKWFQGYSLEDIIVADSKDKSSVLELLNFVLHSSLDDDWEDRSDKKSPPPDFVSAPNCIMMEVMMVDDRAFETEDHHIINKTKSSESDLYKQVKSDSKLLNDSVFVAIGDSGLPYTEDHNYDRYLQNFKRVVNKHKGKIDLYQKNNPDCNRLIFFIFDESTPYVYDKHRGRKRGLSDYVYTGLQLHRVYFDKSFLSVFDDPRIDCVIWFAPYKVYTLPDGSHIQFPPVYVFSGKHHRVGIKYNKSNVFSAEL
ncbi:MAG: hypothetical protein RBR71_13605 [Gudongella sp.]|nr:hypothetical protein [Gudongella sp.]